MKTVSVDVTVNDPNGNCCVTVNVELAAEDFNCEVCHGNGMTSLAIDGNGITQSEWSEWDEDSMSLYLNGGYDKPCGFCKGTGNVLLPVSSLSDELQMAAYMKYMELYHERVNDFFESIMPRSDYYYY